MTSKILYLFTRTPLHVGAGASVGAIDQPIVRERHTGFPIIPASALKGTFADAWNDQLFEEKNDKQETRKVRVKADGTASEAAWLFGSDSDKHAAAGALQFSEARLLAFPIRSARGSFAWITCPLILQRAVRDGVLRQQLVQAIPEPEDEQAMFPLGKLNLATTRNNQPLEQIVLEEYTFTRVGNDEAIRVGEALAGLFDDSVWWEIASRLVVLSNGMMSFFTQNACEVAQHVRISDETGAAEGGALFNQENVPSETLFYSVLHAFSGRSRAFQSKTPENALDEFAKKIGNKVFQFGGDASTGLGYCSVQLKDGVGLIAHDQKGM
ncbi:MAG: type III-B CRISPR module RAMP protein Cmr4 [Verrucomicrobia bacterium]|jgi:CRISPR-associated protein Cmr4|nr:type III-B CRISPR module RAMP protein Cmr4 [Verrucomicrobiota bacterium]